MSRRCESAAKKNSRHCELWIEVVDGGCCENGSRYRPDKDLNRLPDARDTGNKGDDKFDRIDRGRQADDPGGGDNIQSGRKVADPSLALSETKDRDRGGNIDTGGVRDTESLRQI